MCHVAVHKDNPGNNLHILDILNEMRRAGFESAFIYSLMEHCQRYEGIWDLMEMWFDETNPKERDKIVADLQESLNDIIDLPYKPEERPYLRFDDLDNVRSDILEFKKQLRREVDRHGGGQ